MRLTRMFGLAVLVALAMSAVAAAAASAAQFFHEAEEAKVIAHNEGAHKFTAGIIGTISCEKATFTGELVTSPQKTVTVTPKYEVCSFLGVEKVNVTMHKCKYTFNEPTGTKPSFTGSVNIVNCPKSEPIEFEANGCKIHVFEQGPLSTIKYTDLATTPKSVKIEASVTKIAYEAIGLCKAVGLLQDGEYSGSALADAESAAETLVGGFIE